MLREDTTIDKIEVLPNGVLQIRQKSTILKDEVEVASSFHRWILAPGDALDGQDERVVAVANAIWTPEIVQAYQDWVAEQERIAAELAGQLAQQQEEEVTENDAQPE